MNKIFGKTLLTDLAERFAPEHTALVIVDVQNDFCSEGGMIHQLGHDLNLARTMVSNLRVLLEPARARGMPIIYVKNQNRPDGIYNAPADLARRLESYADEKQPLITLQGSWGEEIVDLISPKQGDVIVTKHRPDAFQHTDLNLILRSNGIKSVIITGTATFACVESTARRAMMEDYYVTVVEDCVSATDDDLHFASLKVMRSFFGNHGVMPSSELIKTWETSTALSV